ncbi:DUF2167 domain-containing protein [Aquabacterium sp.]|uniref:DUF2167 domain-containing protein n=1 Tax=Aquabacterium sp. TaxID=1872578 RepID=UPI0035AEAA97
MTATFRFVVAMWLTSLACLSGLVQPARAADTPDPREAEQQAAFEAVKKAQVVGPAEIKLRDQAVLKLPTGYVWVPEPAAAQLMRAMGNHPDEREMGLVFPQSDDEHWMAVAEYESAGYVKDDDAKNWNVDDLLKSVKDGTDAGNEERRQRGFPELEVLGWVEKPAYDAGHHRLVWSISARHKGAAANEPTSINYNTYALGREGYVTLDLISSADRIEHDKGNATTLLAALDFNTGKRYADFDAKTDHVAEYGLAALVGGLAAKKLGMFALAAGLFAKFAKVIALAAAGAFGVFTKFFKGKKDSSTPPSA